jgi:hypothetical protein
VVQPYVSPVEVAGKLAALHDDMHGFDIFSGGVWVSQVQVGMQGMAEGFPLSKGGLDVQALDIVSCFFFCFSERCIASMSSHGSLVYCIQRIDEMAWHEL